MRTGSDWVLRYPATDMARHYRDSGWWNDDTLTDIAFRGVVTSSAVSCRVRSQVHPFRGTIGEVGDMGRRLAGALARRGVEAGDVVAFQIPNWVEAAACFYGLLSMGVVVVPIAHIYGSKEVGHILRQSGARVLITADHFARQDYVANLEVVLPELPDLELVVIVPTDRAIPKLDTTVLAWSEALDRARPLDRPPRVDPDGPALIGYTSGTTAAPKGVIHTHRTFLADQRTWATFLGEEKSPAPRVTPTASLTVSPVGHIMGLTSVLRPLFAASPLDLMDVWQPAAVLAAMAADGVATGGGPPYFLLSLLDHPDFDPDVHLPYMDRLTMGGAPIPTALARRATDLGISLIRAYGSTEHPSTTASLHSDPLEKRIYTDGRIISGSEIRLLDAEGRPVPAGLPGEIHSRGPELFAGYTDPALTADAIDRDGWYDTGDIGVLDPEGYLTITDRKKDIIIRGGENVSSAEVEGVLAEMAGVAEVAVVAAPDARYGEHGAAVIKLLPDAGAFDLASAQRHLEAGGLARQKWPEELHFVSDFPRTPSGKIQKNLLRSILRADPRQALPFEGGRPGPP
ncbi:MAG TPA: AMP-binding protein [Acidimicrobiales bacterium]|nr:AMP-binding protein [Acidimicrobiales bacterium]